MGQCSEAPDYTRPLMAKALVTGGAGFIGSNLVRALLERGDDVRVLDNFSTGNRANLDGLDVEIVEGELRSYERVHNAVRGTEVVYHLGALGSVPRSVQDPLTSSAVNVEGTLNVLLAARDEGVRRVVFSSSSSVYGAQPRAAGDRGARRPTRSRRTASRSSRPSATASASRRVYESFETVVAALLQRLRPAAEPVLAVRGGGPALHHRDRRGRAGHDLRRRRAVARLHLRRQRRRRDDPRGARRRARAGGSSTSPAGSPASVNDVADTIGRILGKPVEKQLRAAARRATSATRGPTCRRPSDVLGYEPSVGLEDGLRRTIDAPAWLSRPIKVLRVIARLNVGGPALHVAYLTAGLADRGYETTLVAGTLARGEESMAFVADALGVRRRDARRPAAGRSRRSATCARCSGSHG